MTDAREQRGTVIADTCKIEQRGKLWSVPSQSNNGTYSVNVTSGRTYCSCPDHAETGVVCKHIYAVRITLSRSVKESDGSETTTTVTVERKTYKQDWPNYNAAQSNEHRHFMTLLADLCGSLPAPTGKRGRGRPTLLPSDAAYSACLKVYSTMSARRFVGDLDESFAKGHISKVPHYNSVLNYFDAEGTEDVLQGFIKATAAPLEAIETKFAIDSTGFAGARFVRWFDEKYGTPRSEVHWVKLHAVVGVATNVITSCEVLEKHSPDAPQLPGLIADTAERFTVAEVSGDKAYASRKNCEAVENAGGQFYPAFKKDTTGGVGGAFKRAFHLFAMNSEEYGRKYHLRSNIESTFSSVKRVFGSELRSKTERAMRNEALAKCVCHNIRTLVHAIYELGITPMLGLDTCPINNRAAQVFRVVS